MGLRALMPWFLLTVVCVTNVESEDMCPFQWETWEDQCLYMDAASLSPRKADQACQNEGSNLLVIESKEHNNYLNDKLLLGENDLMVLGCRYVSGQGKWMCFDKPADSWYWFNQTASEGYWNWHETQPDLIDDGCLVLKNNGQWYDEPCNTKQDIVVTCVQAKQNISTPVRCPLLWQPVDNKCVLFIPDVRASPQDANQLCTNLNGYMFVVDSEEQNRVATEELQASDKSTGLILGCTDMSTEGSWECSGRSPYLVQWTDGMEVGYWNWGDGEPSGGDCMALSKNGSWLSGNCTTTYSATVACESEPTTIECPPDYEPWNDKCLLVSSFNGTALEARNFCDEMDGGKIIVIGNKAENILIQYLLDTVEETNMLIGCSDVEEEGTWTCEGQDPDEFYWKELNDNAGYWNWREDPNGVPSKDCVFMRSSGKYSATGCGISGVGLLACTHDAINVPSSTSPTSTTEISTSPELHTTSLPTSEPSDPKTTQVTTKVATTKDAKNPAPQSGLSSGGIAAIVICVIVVVLVVGILGYAYLRPRSSVGRAMPRIWARKSSATLVFDKSVSESHLITE